MPIKAAGIEVTALKLGGVNVARAKYNGIEVFTAFRPPSPITFSITAGFASGLIGYWGARGAGSISDASIVTLDGEAATVTQLAFGPSLGTNELRFSIRQAGLGVGDADQFPVEIRIARGSTVGTFVPKATEDIRATSDGVSRDYVPVSGGVAPSSVIQFGQRSRVTISWTRDTTPDFGTATIAAQSWMQNTAITDLVLPAATGGNSPLTYSLSPALPAGLTFTAATRTISGTPSAAAAEATYTYTVTDADGDTDTIQFSITVAASGRTITATLTIPANRYIAFRDGGRPVKAWGNITATEAPIPAEFRASRSVATSLRSVWFYNDGSLRLDLTSGDFSDAWETTGTIRFQSGSFDVALNAPGDRDEPYAWPAGTIATQQYNAIASGVLTITLTVPVTTVSGAISIPGAQFNSGRAQRGGQAATIGFKRWSGNTQILVPQQFRDDPAVQLYVSQLVLWQDGYVSLQLGPGVDPSLTDAWEAAGTMRVQAVGIDITLDAPGNGRTPYDWPTGTITTAQYNAAGGPCTITLAAPSVAPFTQAIALPTTRYSVGDGFRGWSWPSGVSNPTISADLVDRASRWFAGATLQPRRATFGNRLVLQFSSQLTGGPVTGADLSDAFEARGEIVVVLSTGERIALSMADYGDPGAPYVLIVTGADATEWQNVWDELITSGRKSGTLRLTLPSS